MSTTATTTTTTTVEDGGDLPPPEELIPITQSLITPELAGAFSIPHDFFKNQAAVPAQQPSPGGAVDQQDEALEAGSRKVKKQQDADSEDSGNSGGDEPSARTLKRPRLVWTPQLHKRFVDAVAQLGIKSAVPKTIMQLMNVEGLTRENVASHLQKYRLYLKRMQGIPSDGPPSDPLFASTPVPPGLASAAHFLQNHHEVIPLPFTMTHPYADQHHAFAIGRGVQPQQQQPRLAELKDQQVVDLGSIGQQRPGSPSRRVLTLFPTTSY